MNVTIDNSINHFIDLKDHDADTLRSILQYARTDKADVISGLNGNSDILKGKQIAMIFEKPSTRTRVSFESAINKLGGNAIVLESQSSQIGRGETVSDTAKAISRYVDMIMVRCFQHKTLTDMATNASVPVINGLTDYSHPCQVMADIMTFEEKSGSIEGKKIAWIGDCNNVANSWIQASEKFDFQLFIACPEELAPPANLPAGVTVLRDPKEAARDADLVTTDTWVSMGDADPEAKLELLKGYQVDDAVMAAAKKNAIFMHCLPAHRGHEVSASVMDGAKSVVWDEAENRLYVQKAILLWCTGNLANGKIVAPQPYRGVKVLLVEDNNADAQYAIKIFDSIGCEITHAHDGEEAVQKVSGQEFDIVFMDCLMPVMNGFDAAVQIRKMEKDKDKHLPIIAIASGTSTGDQERGKQVGMNDFIVKPIGPRRINNLLKKWYKQR